MAFLAPQGSNPIISPRRKRVSALTLWDWIAQKHPSTDALGHLTLQFKEGKEVAPTLLELIQSTPSLSQSSSPQASLAGWREALGWNLLNHLSGRCAKVNALIAQRLCQLSTSSSRSFSLVEKGYQALNLHLVGMESSFPSVYVDEQGLCASDCHSESFESPLPHPQFQGELTALLALHHHFSPGDKKGEQATASARGLFFFLDRHYRPSPSLFVREKERCGSQLPLSFYLGLHTAALLCTQGELEFVAQKQLSHLTSHGVFPGSALALALYVEQQAAIPPPHYAPLPETFHCLQGSWAGRQGASTEVRLTLSGCGTGLGEIKNDQVGIANFGPGLPPVGSCEHFGIWSSPPKAPPQQEETCGGLEVRGKVALLTACDAGTTLHKLPYWAKMKLSYRENQLYVEADFITSTESPPLLQFFFFLRGEMCQIPGEPLPLVQGSLNRYEGAWAPLSLEKEGSTFMLTPPEQEGTLVVTPLAGGEHFWGADFLASYLFRPQGKALQWQGEFAPALAPLSP